MKKFAYQLYACGGKGFPQNITVRDRTYQLEKILWCQKFVGQGKGIPVGAEELYQNEFMDSWKLPEQVNREGRKNRKKTLAGSGKDDEVQPCVQRIRDAAAGVRVPTLAPKAIVNRLRAVEADGNREAPVAGKSAAHLSRQKRPIRIDQYLSVAQFRGVIEQGEQTVPK